MAAAEGAKTGAKSKSETSEVANAIKIEVQSCLLSPEFREIFSGAVKQAVSAVLLEIIRPLEEKIASLVAKVAKVDNLEWLIARLSVKANDNKQ